MSAMTIRISLVRLSSDKSCNSAKVTMGKLLGQYLRMPRYR